MSEKILLVWEEIPNGSFAFVLDASSEQAAWACASAGKYINSNNEPGEPIEKLSYWVYEEANKKRRRRTDKVVKGPFAKVVVCGFVL